MGPRVYSLSDTILMAVFWAQMTNLWTIKLCTGISILAYPALNETIINFACMMCRSMSRVNRVESGGKCWYVALLNLTNGLDHSSDETILPCSFSVVARYMLHDVLS